MYEEKNSGTNLPAQIDLYATEGREYKFLFAAKGGGSANKTYLFQETKALLNPASLEKFLVEKMKTLGTAACPPYHPPFAFCGPGGGGGVPEAPARSRLRPPVRRKIFRPRPPGRPPAAARGVLPGGDGGLLLRRPEHQGQDRQGRDLAGGDGEEPGQADPRKVPEEARSRGREDRPGPADEGDPRRTVEIPRHDAALAHRDARRRTRHRPRQDHGEARRRRGGEPRPGGR